MDVSSEEGFRQQPGWILVVAVLLIGQAWLTLRLFSPDLSLDRILDDEPIVSGQHPLHYYHGSLGAKTWVERGTSSCFDPAYQAGYPKTPVFDGGSRPAEFFLLLGGSRPAAYKFGVALLSLLVPLMFVAMGRGVGLNAMSSCVSGCLGSFLWWSDPCQALLAAGDIDLLFGGLCVLLHVTWFIRFERQPGIESWLGLTVCAALAWYTQPLLVIGFVPILFLYYLWVATRQGPIWHLAIIAATALAFGLNASWLIDWSQNLWIYLPNGGRAASSTPFWPTLVQQGSQFVHGDPLHVGVAAAGLLGLLVMLRTHRSAAWLLGLGTLEYVVAAAAAKFQPFLADYGTDRFLLIAAWCLVLPAAHLVGGIAKHLADSAGWRPVSIIWLAVGFAGLAFFIDLPRQWLNRPRFEIGLQPARKEIVNALVERTTPDARILWEDRSDQRHGWTALLAVLTERSYLGGLEPTGRLEHMYARLADGSLNGKPIKDWSDAQLLQFFDRYNVGWLVCWSPESIERLKRCRWAAPIADLNDVEPGTLFILNRKPTYFLKGRGQWSQADVQRVALAEIVPEDGEVILSLHYQSNMRVSPGYVQIERHLDLDDPIPFVRLRTPGPVARVSIVWEP